MIVDWFSRMSVGAQACLSHGLRPEPMLRTRVGPLIRNPLQVLDAYGENLHL